MPFYVKDSSNWTAPNNPRIYIKTGAASWNNVKQGFVKTSGGWKQFYIDVEDHFTRTTTGTLGNSDNGFTWTNLFGTFYANGSSAQSDNIPALAYVETNKQDAIISGAVGLGTGVAFWVNPGNSWFAAMSYSDQTTSSYSYSYACGTYACNPVATYTQSCSQCYDVCYNRFYADGSYACPGCSYAPFSGICACAYNCNPHSCNCTNVFAGYSYSTCTSYCTASGTTTNTNYYLQIIGGTTSGSYNIFNTISTAQPVAAIKVITYGTYATVLAYSDAGATNLLTSTTLNNDPIHTIGATGILGTKHGIVKAFSSYGQSSQVFTFSAKA